MEFVVHETWSAAVSLSQGWLGLRSRPGVKSCVCVCARSVSVKPEPVLGMARAGQCQSLRRF